MAILSRKKIELSLRKRIVYWTIVLLAFVIAILCASSLWAVYKQMILQMDARLMNEANDVQRSLTVRDGVLTIDEAIEWGEEHHQYEHGSSIYIMIMNPDQSVFKKSRNLKAHRFPLHSLLFSENEPHFSTETWDGNKLRFMTKPLHLATQNLGWIVLAMPTRRISETLGLLYRIYLILLPLCLFIGIGGSVFIATQILTPIRDITRKARHLNYNNLNEPLPVPNTDDEIADLAQTMNNLLKRLRNNFDSIRQFTAHASHEMKTPLSVVQLELEALEEILKNHETLSVSPRISSEIFRLGKIIDDLSLLAKADTEEARIEKKTIWLNDILFNEIELLLPVARARDITLKVGETQSTAIQGDEYWLRILLSNIIDNAIKYSPAGSTVTCALRQTDDAVTIDVSDQGPGVPEHQIPDLTKRFFRSKDVAHIPGSGLGLSIVAWIVKQHHGTLHFRNRSTGGLIVSVTFPADSSN
ncbi:MAG: sensor histidine kinase [Fidelibacterota bacterium]